MGFYTRELNDKLKKGYGDNYSIQILKTPLESTENFLEEIMRVEEACYAEGDVWDKEGWDFFLRNIDGALFILKKDYRIIGKGVVSDNEYVDKADFIKRENSGLINDLSVIEQGIGLGGVILNAMIEIYKNKGFNDLSAYCRYSSPGNASLKLFRDKLNFCEVGRNDEGVEVELKL